MEFKKWVNSAVLTTREGYRGPEKIHERCTVMTVYNGGAIQWLSDGYYYLNNQYATRDLSEAEMMLWDKIKSA
jgi:hypothetical protein